MNKSKTLTQQLARQAIITGAIVLVGIGVIAGGMMWESSAEEDKRQTESAVARLNTQLSDAQSQIQRSSNAEKTFETIREGRKNMQFAVDSAAFKTWLRQGKETFRFSDSFRLFLSPEQKSNDAQLTIYPFDFYIHENNRLEIDAITDLHVLSFLEAFLAETPGLIDIHKFSLRRTLDVDSATSLRMRTGDIPFFVHANVEFNWAGVTPKPEPKTETPAATP